MSKFYAALAGLAALAVIGVGSSALAASSAGSSVRFVTPKAGATVMASKVTATVKLTNLKINAAAVGKASMAREGHLHFQLDKGKFDFPKYSGANGKLAVKLGVDGTYSPAVKPTITYRNLPKGKHTLKVFLAANNHQNGKSATITFTVR